MKPVQMLLNSRCGGYPRMDSSEIVDPGAPGKAVRTRNGLWILSDPWTTQNNASPTGPWTAPTARRPQAPQAQRQASLD